ARVMCAFAKIADEIECVDPARAAFEGRSFRKQPWTVGGNQPVRRKQISMRFAGLMKSRRAGFLGGLHEECDVVAEGFARRQNRFEREGSNRMLPLVVSRSATIDLVALDRECPRIATLAPARLHPRDHIALAIDEKGRQRFVLDTPGNEVRPPNGRRVVDDSPVKTEFREIAGEKLQILVAVRHTIGILTLGRDRDPFTKIMQKATLAAVGAGG